MNLLGLFIAFVLFFCCPSAARSQEVYAYGGVSQDQKKASLRSGMWGLSYFEDMGKHFLASFTWLNEGHLEKHHRDGAALQMWYRHSLLDKSLSISAGAGPYWYYDTQRRKSGVNINTHGLAPIVSLAITWHFSNQWLVQL